MQRRPVLAFAFGTLVLAVACGKKEDPPPPAKQDAGVARPTVAPLVMPPLGVDRVQRMAFLYGAGAEHYGKAQRAYKGAPDWAKIRTECEAAIAADPMHLDAHWLLASALAQLGDPAAAVEHVVIAITADYYHYGPMLGTEDLKELMATPHGKAVADLATRIEAEYVKQADSGVLVVARRSPYAWPEHHEIQASFSRGELYAYDRPSRRYLRLTHTEHQVAGFQRAPSGGEIALLGFDKIDRPDRPGDKDPPPLVNRAWVQVVSTKDWKPLGPRANLPSAREVELGYAAGEQLLVSTAPATGRWTVGERVVSSVDKTGGRIVKVAGEMPPARIVLAVDDAELVRTPDDVKAAWAGDPAVAPGLEIGGYAIVLPESGQVTRSTVAVAPDKAHAAFATAVDPCGKGVAPSLYVADIKAKTLHHVLTETSRFATRWLDATTLAYEDGDGTIRLWDVKTARESGKLEDKAGIALDVLSIAPGPVCKAGGGDATTTATGSGSGDEPPEEPVTSPN